MQCYEFEMLLRYMAHKLAEIEPSLPCDRLDLADMLIDQSVTSIDRAPDVVSLARNLQTSFRRIAA